MTVRVLHVIPALGIGGGGRAALTAAMVAADHADQCPRIASLRPAHPWMLEDAASAGIEVLNAPSVEELCEEMAAADVVQVHYWNSPELQELLERDLPPIRLIVWAHVAGHTSPQLLPRELLAAADVVVASSPLNARVTTAVLGSGDGGLPEIAPIGGWGSIGPAAHSKGTGFVIGYVGTVGFVKMAPEFAELCARVPIPNAHFVVCGTGDAARSLPGQMATVGLADRCEFTGHVRGVGPILSRFDVLGYPLRPDSSGSSDLVVKEAMYAGVPPVVLPHGGVDELVDNDRTGIVAEDGAAYVSAIERLHADDGERERLGAAAREHAERHWAPEVVGPQWRPVLDRAMAEPKRERFMIPPPSGGHEGARRFLRGVGREASAFRASMNSASSAPAEAADREIAGCLTPVGLSEGGLLDFVRRYPDDALLALWSGLFMGANGHQALGAGLLSKAGALGCPAERVAPHLEALTVS